MIDSILEIESVLIKAIQKLDLEMFKEFYLNVEDYKHSRKLYFLRDLELAFSKFRKLGDTVIVPNLGSCGGCNKGCYGYQFVGNNSKNYFDLVFEKEADKIKGIKECSELKVINKVQELKNKIYLHDFNNPSSPNNVPF
jgi:hypothetical protein